MSAPRLGVWALLLLAGFAALYHVRYQSAAVMARAAALEAELREARAAQRILQAEWSHLNDPRRLQALAQTYLDLAPLHAAQLMPFGPTRAPMLPVALDGAAEAWR